MKARYLALLLTLLVAGGFGGRVGAQNIGFSVTNTPNPAIVNDELDYVVLLTNLSGVVLSDVFITNSFPATVEFLSATSTQALVSTNGNNLIFTVSEFDPGFVVELDMAVLPTVPGPITNLITIAPFPLTNQLVTNRVFTIAGTADLGVSISAPASGVLVGDQFGYQLTVTNAGPNSVVGVFLSNSLPAGVNFVSVTPTNHVFNLTSNSVSINLGTLPAGVLTNLTLTLQATNAGVFAFTNTVGANGLVDANPTNNTATTNITISAPQLGVLVASNVSAMTFNPQTGLMQQTVQLLNIGTNPVASARVIVSGLTNQLYNAVGTNGGNPYVVYGATLNPAQSVNLILEYFVPTRQPISVPNSAYTAVGVPAVNLTAPGGTPFAITLMTNVPSVGILIEFQSIPGRSYTILYSDNSGFTNALMAQPPIIAPADRTQWIDDGPPKTTSAPSNTTSRFYKILLNQ